jgi:hypothetical protein
MAAWAPNGEAGHLDSTDADGVAILPGAVMDAGDPTWDLADLPLANEAVTWDLLLLVEVAEA